jgi:gas vesicle protein
MNVAGLGKHNQCQISLRNITSKERNISMSAGRILLGVILGMAAGAALGVLFAPDKGSMTRKRLTKQGTQYITGLKNTASEYVDDLGDKFESARERAIGIADRAKGAVDALVGHEPQKQTRRA